VDKLNIDFIVFASHGGLELSQFPLVVADTNRFVAHNSTSSSTLPPVDNALLIFMTATTIWSSEMQCGCFFFETAEKGQE